MKIKEYADHFLFNLEFENCRNIFVQCMNPDDLLETARSVFNLKTFLTLEKNILHMIKNI